MHYENKLPGVPDWQWSKLTPDIVKAYNSSYNRSIGMSPDSASKEKNIKAVVQHRTKYFHTFKYAKQIEAHSKFAFEKGDKVYKAKD